MPEYTLRNVDPHVWSQFINRAKSEGWPTRAIFSALMEAYSAGRFTPATLPPVDMPQYGWLRGYYRDMLARDPKIAEASTAEQWDRLTATVADSRAGLSWHDVDAVPIADRDQTLQWLAATSVGVDRPGFTLRAIAHAYEGPDRRERRAFQYEVLGLPPGQQAMIADFNGGWRTLLIPDGETRSRDWGLPHPTIDDSLDTLARELAAHEAE
jgi:hypothetical protein